MLSSSISSPSFFMRFYTLCSLRTARSVLTLATVAAQVSCSSAAAVQVPAATRAPIAAAPAEVTAFVDVTVVPMDTNRVLTGQTVLIKDGRILALGPAKKV